MKGKNLLVLLLVVAFVIGVILILTLFLPVIRRPIPPVPQVQVIAPTVQSFPMGDTMAKPYTFEKAQNLYDPFTSKTVQINRLQEEMDLKNIEIELLKLELEKIRLESQIDSLRKLRGTLPQQGYGRVRLSAISASGGIMKALLDDGISKSWVREGDRFAGYQVIKVSRDGVELRTASGQIMYLKPGE
ncbi:MAG: hypothetical protein ABIM02_03260 [candidate division WOR-3 bacterium]